MKLAANISMMYGEFEFPDRIVEASRDGFKAIECMFPYAYDAQKLSDCAQSVATKFVLINAPAGDWEDGERGLAVCPTNKDRFKQSIDLAMLYADKLNVRQMHVLAGTLNDLDADRALDCYLDNLHWLCEQTVSTGITWLIEPLNRRDVPGYLLSTQKMAHDIVMQLGFPNLKVQMDLYHCQVSEGDVITKLRQYIPTGRVGHIQIAGAPERFEPHLGELSMPRVFNELELLEYTQYIGCEYRPKSTTREGLAWLKMEPFSGKI